MNPYSPISWLYVYGFLGQNLKKLDLEVIAGYLEKRISVNHFIGLFIGILHVLILLAYPEKLKSLLLFFIRPPPTVLKTGVSTAKFLGGQGGLVTPKK